MTARTTNLRKVFGDARKKDQVVALDGVDLEVGDAELVVVVGPSGSGKTTLPRCLAGLEEPDEGRIEIDGRDVGRVPAGKRNVAMVFQDFALFPHLTAAENIAFGLRARKVERSDIDDRVRAAARQLRVEEALGRRPEELSGGERQRVALARAIVREPAVFLLDEPLSNLDAELRSSMRVEIRTLQRRLGVSALHVTHDQTEAMTMGDRVAVLRAGRIEQVATPSDLYDRPATAFVAAFVGSPPMNVVPAGLLGLRTRPGMVGVRPENLVVTAPSPDRIQGRVDEVEMLGDVAVIHLAVNEHALLAKVPRRDAPAPATLVGVTFDENHVHRFDQYGRRI